MKPINLVVLISGNGSNLQAIIDAICAGACPAHIRAVISDQADAYGLERARQAGINTHVIPPSMFPERNSFDLALLELINRHTPDLVIMAGFMRILGNDIVKAYNGRLMNIHPALLPKYKGLNTHKRVLEAGEKETGTSVHFVTDELDGGPIIAQEKIAVLENDTPATLEQRVKAVEHQLYPQVITLFAQGKLS